MQHLSNCIRFCKLSITIKQSTLTLVTVAILHYRNGIKYAVGYRSHSVSYAYNMQQSVICLMADTLDVTVIVELLCAKFDYMQYQ